MASKTVERAACGVVLLASGLWVTSIWAQLLDLLWPHDPPAPVAPADPEPDTDPGWEWEWIENIGGQG